MLRTAALALMLLSNLTCAQAVKSFTGAIFAAPAQSSSDSTYLSGVETTLNAAAAQAKLDGKCGRLEAILWPSADPDTVLADFDRQLRALGYSGDTLPFSDQYATYFTLKRSGVVVVGLLQVQTPVVALVLCPLNAVMAKTPPVPAVKPPAARPAAASVTISAPNQINPGQPLKVHLAGLPGNAQDWVTVVSSTAPDTSYGQYFYTGGKREADFSFNNSLAAGEYEVRVYFNYPAGGYTVRARRAFSVKGSAAPTQAATPAPTSKAARPSTVTSIPPGKYVCSTLSGSQLIGLGDLLIRDSTTYQGIRLGGGGPIGTYQFLPATQTILWKGELGGNFKNIILSKYISKQNGGSFIEITYQTEYQHTMSCGIEGK